jgi:hypothetical protein
MESSGSALRKIADRSACAASSRYQRSLDGPRPQQSPDVFHAARRAEQITLHLGAAEEPDMLQLLFRLDAFGGRQDAEVSRQAGDRLHDRARIIAVAETADSSL